MIFQIHFYFSSGKGLTPQTNRSGLFFLLLQILQHQDWQESQATNLCTLCNAQQHGPQQPVENRKLHHGPSCQGRNHHHPQQDPAVACKVLCKQISPSRFTFNIFFRSKLKKDQQNDNSRSKIQRNSEIFRSRFNRKTNCQFHKNQHQHNQSNCQIIAAENPRRWFAETWWGNFYKNC